MFIKTPANKQSLAMRKLVHGAGINDADYLTSKIVNGKAIMCPAYRKWADMLMRCYNAKYQEKNPTYKGCSVCSEWLIFSNFANWFNCNNVEGWQLDKDLKVHGNKIYNKDTCLMVPQEINHLILNGSGGRGCCPIGVTFHKRLGRYQSQIKIDGKQTYLGVSATPESARKKYITAKNKEITRKSEQYPEFAQYLSRYLLE